MVCNNKVESFPSGQSGCVTEPGEDHVLILPVHGDVYGAGTLCGEFSVQHNCLITIISINYFDGCGVVTADNLDTKQHFY